MLEPISKMGRDLAGKIRGIFFDIDDTFTLNGRIPSCAFEALWLLRKRGIRVIPVTGRPAGWCDHIARMWPVDAIVGENGAFYFWFAEKEGRLKKRFLETEEVRRENKKRLDLIRDKILSLVPGTLPASDQAYRESDLAIDYCEDVPRLGLEEIERICRIFRSHGATCKVSSVHVNGWFGEYDKLGMTRLFVREVWGSDLDAVKESYIFCGDSPNDEPMFAYFPCSVGVKNILRFSDRMTQLPLFITRSEGGEGFAEMAASILGEAPVWKV
jgi:HAD superfamily hydrolase (TIGR01484 family)